MKLVEREDDVVRGYNEHPTTNGNFRDGTKSSLLRPCRLPRTMNMYHRIQSKNITHENIWLQNIVL